MDCPHHLGQPVTIAVVTAADTADWAALRHALWSQSSADEHAAEMADLLIPGNTLTLLARRDDGTAIGFAEASIRHDYVNGCDTTPVGFLEGIYVVPQHRRAWVARQLVETVTVWVRSKGCTEMASDAAIGNSQSHQMHNARGFEETQRVVYFRKTI